MRNLEPKKVIIIILLLVAVVGFIDATYLTAKHYMDDPVTCSILDGCESVTTSKYSTLFGIPISLFGSIYYLTAFILLILYKEGVEQTQKLFALIATAAFAVTLFLLYIQISVLQAFCLYCLISTTTSTLLFLGALYLLNPDSNRTS